MNKVRRAETKEEMDFNAGVYHGISMCHEVLAELVNPYNAQTVERFSYAINRAVEEWENLESERSATA